MSQERFEEIKNGMERSLSGRSSLPTRGNSLQFDEASREPHNFAADHSGEMRFENSDYSNESQTHFVELSEKHHREGRWSPQKVNGNIIADRGENFPLNYEFRSDVWRFSEDSNANMLSVIMEEDPSKDTTVKAESVHPEPESSSSSSSEDNCCADCGDGPCKIRALMEAGFPGFGGFPGWGPFAGFPAHTPGVPATNLNITDKDDEKMNILKDLGISREGTPNFKGKMMVYAEKNVDSSSSSDDDEDKRRCGGAAAATAGEETNAEETDAESVATTKTGLTSCASDMVSLPPPVEVDILAAVKERKAVCNDFIDRVVPLREKLESYFSQGIYSGEQVDGHIEAYNAAYNEIFDAIGDWRMELAKLDCNANDENLGFVSGEQLLQDFKDGAAPAGSGSETLAKAIGCNELEKLEKVGGYVQKLLNDLPLEEFGKLHDFMYLGLGNVEKPEGGAKTGGNAAGDEAAALDAELAALAPKKKNDYCHGFCETTCTNVHGQGKKKKKGHSRAQMADALATSIVEGSKKGSKSVAALNAKKNKMKGISCRNKPTLEEKLVRQQQCFAPACDGRNDFRQMLGMDAMKNLFPILVRITTGGSPVTGKELFTLVKENEIGSGEFTQADYTKMLNEWKKRVPPVDEAIFAVCNPGKYLELTPNIDAINKAMHKWETKNPNSASLPRKLERFPKPPGGDMLKPSKGPMSVASSSRSASRRPPPPITLPHDSSPYSIIPKELMRSSKRLPAIRSRGAAY